MVLWGSRAPISHNDPQEHFRLRRHDGYQGAVVRRRQSSTSYIHTQLTGRAARSPSSCLQKTPAKAKFARATALALRTLRRRLQVLAEQVMEDFRRGRKRSVLSAYQDDGALDDWSHQRHS